MKYVGSCLIQLEGVGVLSGVNNSSCLSGMIMIGNIATLSSCANVS